MKGRLIVVSNRLPVSAQGSNGTTKLVPSAGGLVSALLPVFRRQGGSWVGWAGCEESLAARLREEWNAGPRLEPVFLTEGEKQQYYDGCANQALWPLFHDLASKCRFEPAYWMGYREATDKFADAVEAVAEGDDLVWVQDYHLMLLGEALRARGSRVKLAYFHHVPFPAADIFERLPWRREVLRGLMHFHSVGFQTERDRRNFTASVRRHLEDARVRRIGPRFLVHAGGLTTMAGTYPISIDFHEMAMQAESGRVREREQEIRRQVPGQAIVMGLDRLDYTKGLLERVAGFRELLARHPELRGRVTLLQVVVPSREQIPPYRELRLSLEQQISAINGQYGGAGWTPIVYLYRSVSREEMLAMYRAAAIALITPLRDGMNLVAKEFCAARTEEDGVLILSEFAGAAEELKTGALLVNPYDVEAVASALVRGLAMERSEQRARMRQMRETIAAHDVFRWCAMACSQSGESANGRVVGFEPRPALAATGS